jgi:hypothetical protein
MVFGVIEELKKSEEDNAVVIKDIESALKRHCLTRNDAFSRAVIKWKQSEKGI